MDMSIEEIALDAVANICFSYFFLIILFRFLVELNKVLLSVLLSEISMRCLENDF